jgi:multiple sugar transport system permease protein
MFKKSHPLQSKSEIILRNIVVLAMVVFFIVFLIIPIGIAFAGSFHEWNPLSGTYKFLGLENYKQVFTSKLFGKSMFNTVIFSVVVIVFRVGLGLGIAYAIYSTLIKHKSFFRAVYYMPVVTPMVAVAFVWKFMYNPQIGTINKIFGLDINWLMNPKTALIAVIIMTIWKDFGYAVVMYMAGLYSLPADVMEAARELGFIRKGFCQVEITRIHPNRIPFRPEDAEEIPELHLEYQDIVTYPVPIWQQDTLQDKKPQPTRIKKLKIDKK